jgi:hypothetical protein
MWLIRLEEAEAVRGEDIGECPQCPLWRARHPSPMHIMGEGLGVRVVWLLSRSHRLRRESLAPAIHVRERLPVSLPSPMYIMGEGLG